MIVRWEDKEPRLDPSVRMAESAAAVGDDVIGTRGWLQQAVVDLFVGIGNLAPIGLRGPLVVGAGEKQERGRSQ